MKYESKELAHFGIPGQKWGVRRFQNPDGTLTEEGKRRYYDPQTINDAKSDADAYGRAKRLGDEALASQIKTRVKARFANDPDYEELFREFSGIGPAQQGNQNTGLSQGQTQRVLGGIAAALAVGVTAIGGASLLKKTGVAQKIGQYAKAAVTSVKNFGIRVGTAVGGVAKDVAYDAAVNKVEEMFDDLLNGKKKKEED